MIIPKNNKNKTYLFHIMEKGSTKKLKLNATNKNQFKLKYIFIDDNKKGGSTNNANNSNTNIVKDIIDSDLIKLFTNLDELLKINILIYAESIGKSIVSDQINKFIVSLTKNYKFNNVTLIHETSDLVKCYVKNVYNINNELIFRKIINIMSYKKYIENNLEINDNKSLILDTTYNLSFGDDIVNFMIVDTSRHYNNDDINFNTYYDNQIWFKNYINDIHCAYGRLLQISGTCWLNAVINGLFLSNGIVKILVERYEQWMQEQLYLFPEINRDVFEKKILDESYKKLCYGKDTIKIHLYKLVYLLLINKIKPRATNSNIMIGISEKIIKVGEFGDENKNTEIGPGYHGFKGLDIILNIFFESNRKYFCLLNIKNSNIESQIFNSDDKIKINDKIISDFNLLCDSAITKQLSPKLLAINFALMDPSRKVPLNIELNNKTYILEFSILLFINTETKLGHIIPGLICEDIFYTYDSHNFIIKTDWHMGDVSNYLNLPNRKKYIFNGIVTTIYRQK